MPITIRDKKFDREMADEAKIRGGISKTAAIMSLAAERRAQLKLERDAAKDAAREQHAAATAGAA